MHATQTNKAHMHIPRNQMIIFILHIFANLKENYMFCMHVAVLLLGSHVCVRVHVYTGTSVKQRDELRYETCLFEKCYTLKDCRTKLQSGEIGLDECRSFFVNPGLAKCWLFWLLLRAGWT